MCPGNFLVPDMEEAEVECSWLDCGVSSLDSCSKYSIDFWTALLTIHEDSRSSAWGAERGSHFSACGDHWYM